MGLTLVEGGFNLASSFTLGLRKPTEIDPPTRSLLVEAQLWWVIAHPLPERLFRSPVERIASLWQVDFFQECGIARIAVQVL